MRRVGTVLFLPVRNRPTGDDLRRGVGSVPPLNNDNTTEIFAWNFLFWIPVFKVPVSKPVQELLTREKHSEHSDHSDVLISSNIGSRLGISNVLHLPPPLP